MGRTAQTGQKYKGSGDVATILVSLDSEKPALSSFAPRYGDAWTVLCDYKGWDSKPARDYGVKSIPSAFVFDAVGRMRLGPSLEWMSAEMVEDLRIEAARAKKHEPAVAPVAPLPAPAPAGVQWTFHLKSGGRLKVVSYEEKEGKYLLKLAAGSTSVAKEDVDRIVKFDPAEK